MKSFILSTLLLLPIIMLSTNSMAAGEAMFGLNWGETVEKIKEQNIELEKFGNENNITYYKTNSLPENFSDIEVYILIFDDYLGLVKVFLQSKDFENDIYGSNGKDRFNKIRQILKEKYKMKDEARFIGQKLYDESDEFYQCLNYKGCGYWASTFETSNKFILLELIGKKRGVGFYELSVEAVPEWKQTLKKLEGKKAKSDDDAL